MARERGEHPIPPASSAPGAQPRIVEGDQGSPASEPSAPSEPRGASPDQRLDDELRLEDALRRWQRDEILRATQALEGELKSILHELARDRNRWC